MRGKVAQERRLVGQPHPFNLGAPRKDLKNDLHHVIDVALGVDAPRNGKPHEFHLRGGGNIRLPISTSGYRLPNTTRGKSDAGKLIDRNVRQKSFGVEIDGVAARRLHMGTPCWEM